MPAQARDHHDVAAVVILSRSCGRGLRGACWSGTEHSLTAGDQRDDLPRRCDRAEPAHQGPALSASLSAIGNRASSEVANCVEVGALNGLASQDWFRSTTSARHGE
jgi:hypothetical protein